MRSPWKVGLVLWGIGLLFSSSVSAYVLSGQDWTYQTSPMGEDWRVCTSGMPSSGSQRTQDGASEWNYTNFNFTFGSDFTGCSSYPSNDGTNQVDYGSGLGASVLAQTTWYYQTSTGNIVECDMRFHNAFSWYTGTATPSSSQYDWWSVATHEMGHCLSLRHEDDITDPKPVMFSTFGAGEIRRTLTADDIAGRNAIYSPTEQPDLVVTVLTGPSEGTIGGEITISSTTANQGSASAGVFWTGYYFSTDSTITTSDTFSGWYCSHSSGLVAGASSSCSGSIGVPSSLAPGTYYLGAIADYQGVVAESNETNNTRAADTGPITLGAVVTQFTLTVTKAGTGSGTVTSSPAGINCGADCTESYISGTVVTLTATPDSGFTFGGWSGDSDCTDGQVTMNANKTCTATFNVQTFLLSVSVSGSGTVSSSPAGINCPGDCSESYSSGTSVTLTATPGSGSTFSGWSGDCSGTGSCVVSMTANRSVAASFSVAPVPTLSVSLTTLAFGNVEVGSSSDLSFTVTNVGTGTLTGTATTTSPFSVISGGSFSLGAGASQTVTVRFSPTSTGSFSGTVSVSSNGGSASVSLSGTGTAPADTIPPTVTITTPTSASTYATSTSPLTLGGTASDNVGVAQVTWSNAATGTSGTASGTTSWTASGITLLSGTNLITVTAKDAAGNTGTDTLLSFA